jgi:hypothetical protein
VIATDVAAALGRSKREGVGWRCNCPIHGGQSLTICDGSNGRLLVRFWGGCDPRAILMELRRRNLIDRKPVGAVSPLDLEAEQRRRDAEVADRQRRISLARDIWQSALSATGTGGRTLSAFTRHHDRHAAIDKSHPDAHGVRVASRVGTTTARHGCRDGACQTRFC